MAIQANDDDINSDGIITNVESADENKPLLEGMHL